MKDQYGDQIPSDLVYLDWGYVRDMPQGDDQNLLTAIVKGDWYEIEFSPRRSILAISWNILWRWQDAHGLIFDPVELSEFGIASRLDGLEVRLVDNVLKRFSDEDGFYHA